MLHLMRCKKTIEKYVQQQEKDFERLVAGYG